jgi:hypothetical protein
MYSMTTFDNIMIDLETLDTEVSATIVSIGAVRFGPDGVHWDSLYIPVAWSSRGGRTISRECLTGFWLKQPAEVQAALSDPAAVPLAEALTSLAKWIGADKTVWAGPATFDLSILQHAYQQLGWTELPWAFYQTRCYSTLRRTFPEIARVNSTTPHNALEDARAQAQHACALLWHRSPPAVGSVYLTEPMLCAFAERHDPALAGVSLSELESIVGDARSIERAPMPEGGA